MKQKNLCGTSIIALAVVFSMVINAIEMRAQRRVDEEIHFTGQALFDVILPEIEFRVEPERIAMGESVVLRWNVIEADEAIFWKSTVLPSAPEPLDWWRISELGENVQLSDEIVLNPEETTAYYLIANSRQGMRGRRIVVEVIEEQHPPEEFFMCTPSTFVLEKMESKPHVGWIGQPIQPTRADETIALQLELLAKEWSAPSDPPVIKISAKPEVIFEDESSIHGGVYLCLFRL